MDTDLTINNQKRKKPSKTTFIFVLLIVLVIIPLIIVLTDKQQENSQIIPDQRVVTIAYGEDGFRPEHIQISKNTKVLWINKDNETNNTLMIIPNAKTLELEDFGSNEGTGMNGTYEYVFKDLGTLNYHNSFQPEHNGTVEIVED